MEKLGPRVLVVEDEESIHQTLSVVLPPAGYTVYQVRSGQEALRTVQSVRPDLILLDLGLPDMDGKQVIRDLRKRPIAPIIVISVCDTESEKISCLDAGAHDYLTNPFTISELLARMRATLRSVSAAQDDVFTVDGLRVDLGRRQVFVDETGVKLTATEYDLLKMLIRHAGNVRTHHQLIRELWGRTQYQDPIHLLRVTLSHLRRKLQPDPMKPRYIVTEAGVGYWLRTESSSYARTTWQRSDDSL
jgi:two-component system KDP operon response regulator KdpE